MKGRILIFSVLAHSVFLGVKHFVHRLWPTLVCAYFYIFSKLFMKSVLDENVKYFIVEISLTNSQKSVLFTVSRQPHCHLDHGTSTSTSATALLNKYQSQMDTMTIYM